MAKKTDDKPKRGPLDPILERLDRSKTLNALASLGVEDDDYSPIIRPLGAQAQIDAVAGLKRRFVLSQILYVASMAILMIVTLGAWAIATDTQDDINHAVDGQPHHRAQITDITRPDYDGSDKVRTIVTLGTKTYDVHADTVLSLADLFDGHSYDIGQGIMVAIDPADPNYVYDVADRRSLSVGERIGALMFVWECASLFWRYGSKNWKFPGKSRWQLMRTRRISTARVTEIREVTGWKWWWAPENVDTVVIEVEGIPHVWTYRSGDDLEMSIGTEFPVWGNPRPGGWVVGLTEPELLYPRSVLD